MLDFFNQDIQPPSVRSFNVTIGDPRGSKIKIIGGNYYPFDRDTLRYDWRGLSEGVYNINLSGFGISRCLSAFASPINVDQGIHRDIVAHIGDCTSQRLEIILSRPPRNDAPVHGFTWMIIAE
ncbi:MAG: hypothetical protein NZ866_01595 [Patescibacteria group bacterium]|nr:hypothetical protein [Patescibacteria group bacterium]